MSLFLFTDVLCDWYCGSVLVRAESYEHAIQVLVQEYSGYRRYDEAYWLDADWCQISEEGSSGVVHVEWGGG